MGLDLTKSDTYHHPIQLQSHPPDTRIGNYVAANISVVFPMFGFRFRYNVVFHLGLGVYDGEPKILLEDGASI